MVIFMTDISMIQDRNKLMIKVIWFFLCFDIIVNIMVGNSQMLGVIVSFSLPLLTLITILVVKRKFPIITMYSISVLFLVFLFLLNEKSLDYINLFFLALPPIFSFTYSNWKNTLFTTVGSASIFAYFMLKDGKSYFLNWENTDIYYFLMFFLILAIINIYESRFSEKNRHQLNEELFQVKQLQSSLLENEDRYRSMVKQSLEGIYAFNPKDKSIVEANDRFCEMLGYTEDELMKLTLIDFVVSDQTSIEANIESVLKQNQMFVGERLYRCKNGQMIIVEVRASEIHFNNHTVILANIRDITEQKEIEKALVESEKKYRLIADNMSDFVTLTDVKGTVLYASPSHKNILGVNLTGTTGYSYAHPDDVQSIIDAFKELELKGSSFEVEFRWKDGNDYLHFEMRGEPVYDDNGKIQQVVVITRNITERVRMEEKLRKTKSRMETLIANMPYGIIALDKNQKNILLNHQYKKIFHLPYEDDSELMVDDIQQRVASVFLDEENFISKSLEIMAKRQKVLGEEWNLKDGRIVSRDAVPIYINGNFDGYLWQYIDITKQKKMEMELKEASLLDGLTKISNRRFFDETIEKEWLSGSRNSKPLTLIMLDIDCFKNYNDTYGHPRGDECLIKVAQTIKENIRRPLDVVCRYGGEEFVVILPDTDKVGGRKIAEKIRAAIEALEIPHIKSIVSPYITCSLGVATVIPSKLSTPEEIIRMCDKALYHSKNSGRNCVSFYEKQGTKLYS